MILTCPTLFDSFGIINRIERIWHWKQPIKLQLKLNIFSIYWIYSIFLWIQAFISSFRESNVIKHLNVCLGPRPWQKFANIILRMCGVTFAVIYGCRRVFRQKKKDVSNTNSSKSQKKIPMSSRSLKHRSAILTRTRPQTNRTMN